MEDTTQSPAEVAVVIPTYNRPELLRRAVASAVAQEQVTTEVIVVDDGSTPPVDLGDLPGSVAMARTAGWGGVASARNLGATLARARWLAFLDDDDWWAPDHLRRLVSAADAAGAGFAYAATWDVDLAARQAVVRSAPAPDGLALRLLHENAIGTPSCVMVERSLFMKLGGFDRGLSVVADWDLWIRLARAAPAAAGATPTVAYAAHDENMSLDLPRLLEEFNRLSDRYSAVCRQKGLRFGDPGFPRWMAQLHRRQGRRGRAAAWYLRSSRVPGRRDDAVRALGVLLGERVMGLAARRPQAPRTVPPGWLDAHWTEVPSTTGWART